MTYASQGTNIKVVLAKLGLDGHDRGVKIVARAFRDAGMEVVYMGMRVTPEQVAQTVLQEDADAVGISVLSGAHMRLMPGLTRALDDRQLLGNVLLLVGGTIPQKDVETPTSPGRPRSIPRRNLHPRTCRLHKRECPQDEKRFLAETGGFPLHSPAILPRQLQSHPGLSEALPPSPQGKSALC